MSGRRNFQPRAVCGLVGGASLCGPVPDSRRTAARSTAPGRDAPASPGKERPVPVGKPCPTFSWIATVCSVGLRSGCCSGPRRAHPPLVGACVVAGANGGGDYTAAGRLASNARQGRARPQGARDPQQVSFPCSLPALSSAARVLAMQSRVLADGICPVRMGRAGSVAWGWGLF